MSKVLSTDERNSKKLLQPIQVSWLPNKTFSFLVLPAAQLRDHNEELERELKSTTKLLRDTEDEKRRLEAESKSVSLD